MSITIGNLGENFVNRVEFPYSSRAPFAKKNKFFLEKRNEND